MGILDRFRNLNKNQPDVFQETWFEKCNNAYGCYRTRSSSDANTANLHIEEGISIEWIESFPDLPFKLANVKAYYYSCFCHILTKRKEANIWALTKST